MIGELGVYPQNMLLNSQLILTCEIISDIGLIRTFRENEKTGLSEIRVSERTFLNTDTKPLTRESPEPQT